MDNRDNRTDVVKQISRINFSGNIIPASWLMAIRLPHGAPDMTAIVILAEIIYWYRDYAVRDEPSGKEVCRRKKFNADMLQRSYESFSKLFGFKKSTVQSAIKHLCNLGLIRIEFRTILTQTHIRCNNVMFIEPVPEAISRITLTGGPTKEKLGEGPVEKVGELPKEKRGTNTEIAQRLPKDNKPPSFVLPDWIPKETWEDFEDMRKSSCRPLTDRSRQLTVDALVKLKDQGEDVVACLNQSVQKGYPGVYPVSRNDRKESTRDAEPGESPEKRKKRQEKDAAILARFQHKNDIRLGLIPPDSGDETQSKSSAT